MKRTSRSSEPLDQGSVVIKSRIEEIEIVDQKITQWLEQIGVESSLAYNIWLSVHETVVNAVKHGNLLQIQKKVEVKYGVMGRKIVIEVIDEGSGFNLNELPDPLAPENIWKESGRGIFLIKKFMDRIEFKRDKAGFRVILNKKLPNSP